MYKGFNAISNLAYDPSVPQRLPEIILQTAVILIQVGLEAYILGTLNHYLVKKDPNMEAFENQMLALQQYIVQRDLPNDLRDRLVTYFEFQRAKSSSDQSSVVR